MPETHTLQPWHDEAWCVLLRTRIEELGEARVAALLHYHRSTVSLVARGVYEADPARVARRVLDVFSVAEVPCPVLGTITEAACARHRQAPFRATNPQAVRLYRTCGACIHNPNREEL